MRGQETDGEGGGDGINLEVNPPCIAAGGCVALVIFLLFSFSVIAPTQHGLRYNDFWQTIRSESEGPGRHFVFPWSHYVLFPSTVRTIEFSTRTGNEFTALSPPLKTRTDEGLDLTIHVCFQYELKKEALYDLYKSYKTEYETVFQRQSASVLLSRASRYPAEEYWTNRTVIGESMLEGLQILFEDRASITDLQLMIIDLPTVFEDKIVATEVQKQIKKTREAEQEAAVVRAEIDVMLADFRRQEKIILNRANANATLLEKTATAVAQAARINVETEALKSVESKIPLDAGNRVAYQRGIAYQNIDGAQMMFGVQQAAAIVNTASSMGTQGKMCTSGKTTPERLLSSEINIPEKGQTLLEETYVRLGDEPRPQPATTFPIHPVPATPEIIIP